MLESVLDWYGLQCLAWLASAAARARGSSTWLSICIIVKAGREVFPFWVRVGWRTRRSPCFVYIQKQGVGLEAELSFYG
jgi:hypothetical protein